MTNFGFTDDFYHPEAVISTRQLALLNAIFMDHKFSFTPSINSLFPILLTNKKIPEMLPGFLTFSNPNYNLLNDSITTN